MELDKGCNNLKNVSQVCGNISNVEQIESKVDNMVKVVVTKLYKGKNTDSIETVVDNDSYEIYANLTQIQYSSVSQFPKMGSDRLIYVNKADNSLWRYDTDTSQYSKVGNFDIVNLVGTQENPINFYEDIEMGKIYLISGYIQRGSAVYMLQPDYPDRQYICKCNYETSSYKSITLQGNGIVLTSGGSRTVPPNVVETFLAYPSGDINNYSFGLGFSSFNGETYHYDYHNGFYAPTTSGTLGQILQSNGANTAPTWIDMPSTAPTLEEQTIESASWTSLSGQTPYTYSATITLTTALDLNSIVELINNQPTLFATYGFAIGSISGQVATIYSIGQPSESVTLTLGVTG